ncbi:MAG: hypothetical protein ACRD8W_22860 [Nitrososphaeraceae archaeon]
MSVRFSRCELSFTLFLVIFLGASITIAAMALDMSYSIGEEVLSSTPNMTMVDGIKCDTMEFTMFHIHAHLDIFVDGKPFKVPSQIGIDPEGRCLYWLHTHDDSGIIHIESPVERQFTIGNFIDIWNRTFNNTQLFDTNPTIALSMFVNGVKVPTDTDLRNVNINAHDEIALVFGPIQADKIPTRYEFQQGL